MPTRSSNLGRSRLVPGLLALALGGALTIPLVARTAQATQLQPLDLAALSDRASSVIVGVVEGQRASWTDAQRSSIVTDERSVLRSADGSLPRATCPLWFAAWLLMASTFTPCPTGPSLIER